jgi:hypothetical protein
MAHRLIVSIGGVFSTAAPCESAIVGSLRRRLVILVCLAGSLSMQVACDSALINDGLSNVPAGTAWTMLVGPIPAIKLTGSIDLRLASLLTGTA